LLSVNHAITQWGKIKKPSIPVLAKWIITAWDKITPECIVHSIKKCCISTSTDGEDDDILWQAEDDDLELTLSESEEEVSDDLLDDWDLN
jgi:hypothetical protein